MEEIEEEIWRDIPNYEGYYQASNLGRIKSLPILLNIDYFKDNSVRSSTKKEKILKNRLNYNGYYNVRLYKNKNKKEYSLHRLVLAAFLGESNLIVNHKDSNRKNNNLTNLEYVHRRENRNHGIINNEKTISGYIGVYKCINKKSTKYKFRYTYKWEACIFRYIQYRRRSSSSLFSSHSK